MTWQSGSCHSPPDGIGAAWISTDAYAEPVVIADADAHADEPELTERGE